MKKFSVGTTGFPILKAILVILLAVGSIGGATLFLNNSPSSDPSSKSGPELVEKVTIENMYLQEILVETKGPRTPGEIVQRRGVKLIIEISVKKEREGEKIEEICAFINAISENDEVDATKGDYQESQFQAKLYLPTDCIFEWQPKYEDGTIDWRISKKGLPPLNEDGLTLTIYYCCYWSEGGDDKLEEKRITFELPILNTLFLEKNPDLSNYAIAEEVYPS